MKSGASIYLKFLPIGSLECDLQSKSGLDKAIVKREIMPHSISLRLFFLVILFPTLLLSACASTQQETSNLKRIYDRSAQYHLPDRNPVIVIPGVLGSRLVDEETGVTVWGAFRKDYADPGSAEGARLIALPLTAGLEHEHNHHVKTSVRSDGVL